MSDEWVQSVYVIKNGNAKGFKFTIEIGGKTEMLTFKDCRYVAKTAEHASVIDKLIEDRPSISRMIQKVDTTTGDAVALAHMQKVRHVAAKGGMTTEIMRSMQNDAISKENQQMADAIKADSGLIITQSVDQGADADVINKSDAPAVPGFKLNVNS